MADILASLQQGLASSHTIERELGRGGMAQVFLAHELKHDRLVALKVLDPDLARAIGSERFLREIRLAARLQHPHILTVHDSGEVPGDGHAPPLLWFSMPYVEGESLRDRLRREGQLPIADAVRVARESADALAYAHAHGVIHRDIKPENLLLTGEHTLVADFGVARAVGDEAQHLTGTGLAIGTPAYMSPEQATAGKLDHRSDIYSLGCVLYEMIAGEPPFAGGSPAQVLSRSLSEPLRPLRTLRPAVPPALEQVVATALARAPADRYASATEMVRALDFGGSFVTNDVGRASVRRRVRPALVAGIGLLLLALVAAVAIATRHGGSAPDAFDPDLIAIAPFDLVSSDEGLDVWSEGIVDVVARYFDGAGTLRAVAPTRGIRAWAGRADRESAARFGRAVGAGYVVFGQIVGADSVRLSATLYDVAEGKALDEREWHGAANRLDLLVDSLSTRFLDVMGRTHQLGQPRAQPFGTSDPLAMRAFLSGMHAMRNARYDDATAQFLESVRQDTAFVLGRMYAAHSIGWLEPDDSDMTRLWLEAGVRNRGLAPRDSLLVLADSIGASFSLSGAFPPQLITRLGLVLDTLLASNPDDPEVVFRVADASYHKPLGRSDRWHLDQFIHAIQLDSLYAPAYQHAIQLSVQLESPEAGRALIRRALPLTGSETVRAAAMRLVESLLDPAAPVQARQAALDSVSSAVLEGAYWDLTTAPDSVGLMVARTGERRFPTDREWSRMVTHQLSRRGQLREAATRLVGARSEGVELGWRELVAARELVLVGALPLAFFDSISDESESRTGRLPPEGIPLWVASGDTLRIARLTAQELGAGDVAPFGEGPDRNAFREFHKAVMLLATGDSSAFAAMLQHSFGTEKVPVGLRAFTPFGTFPVDIRLALGAEDAAWELLQAPGGWGSITSPLWQLYRARMAEKRGERDMAIDNYGFIARLWADAEEPLRSYSVEAREALLRLTAER